MYLQAQMPRQPETAWIGIGDSLYALPAIQTQTEVKPGWQIADVAKTKDKTTRYVWGAHSRQLADSAQPRFVLRTQQSTLHDFVIIKLKQKKQYRLLPKAKLNECNPIFIDLHTFRIELLPDERYSIIPLRPMEPGEYLLIDTSAKTVNELGDRMAYEFTISK